MNERVRDILDHTLIWGGLLMAATGIVGEILGWWGDLGLVLTAGGFLAGILGAIDVNGRHLLALVRPMATSIHELAGSIEGLDRSIGSLHAKVDRLSENQDRMLANQDRMLDKHDEAIDQLVRVGDLLDDRLPS